MYLHNATPVVGLMPRGMHYPALGACGTYAGGVWLPARLTVHSRQWTVQCRQDEPRRHHLLAALRGLRERIPPRVKALALA